MPVNLNNASTQLLYSTTRVVAETGADSSVGTAFFFNFKGDDDRNVPVLVTNKHVIDGADQGQILIHEAIPGPDGTSLPSPASSAISVLDFSAKWIRHPGGLDLCAMPVGPIGQQLRAVGKDPFYRTLSESLIWTDDQLAELTALEEVVMVGYPIGLSDSVNNLPILRRGITASHPGVDFEGKSLGVVDIAVFPGSSGSPVMILNQGTYATTDGIVVGSRVVFLGILASGPQFSAEGAMQLVDIPTAQGQMISTNIPIHLGFYIKAKELLVLKDEVFREMKVS